VRKLAGDHFEVFAESIILSEAKDLQVDHRMTRSLPEQATIAM
jgi:hypothetical protein